MLTLKNKNLILHFNELGGELISAKSTDNTEYIWQGKAESWKQHAPLLFPICGRLFEGSYTWQGKLYKMPAHGFLSSMKPLSVVLDNTSLEFMFESNSHTKSIYPFDFSLSILYRLNGDTLYQSVKVKNNSNTIMPFMLGNHPGFNLPLDKNACIDDYFIDFGSKMLRLNELVPGTPFARSDAVDYFLEDNKWRYNRAEILKHDTLIFSNTSNQIRFFCTSNPKSVTLKLSDDYKYVCLWHSSDKDSAYICIEPWTGIPLYAEHFESFEERTSMIRIFPKETKQINYSIEFQ